jgi:hypothetical protein
MPAARLFPLSLLLLLALVGCTSGGSAGLQPNRIDAMGLSRDTGDPVANELLDRADAYYDLYRDSGGQGYYDQHRYAVDGALQRLDGLAPGLQPEDLDSGMHMEALELPTMPTSQDDELPLAVPMGRA